MTNAITPAQASHPAEPRADGASSLSRLAGDYTSFLKLLTAQVSNQDPLEPMDSSTFVTQLAQLSQVEQSVRTNSNLENISAQLAGTAAMAELHLIGRNITVTGENFRNSDGPIKLGYQLAGEASEVSAKIMSADGTVVRTIHSLPTSAGTRHFFEWDGLDGEGQIAMAEDLSFELVATSPEEEDISHSGYVSAAIDSIVLDGDTPSYVLNNGDTVTSDRIVEVR